MRIVKLSATFLPLLLCGFQAPVPEQAAAGVAAAAVMQQQLLQETVPASVFFAGKVATTQLRNSGGVQAGEGNIIEFALVDASGYSSGLRERYQFSLLTSVAMDFGGQRLEPGAYGGGFVEGHALLMNLGGKELLQVPVSHEAEFKRPRPLQVAASEPATGTFRLYLGRDYVSFRPLP